MGDYIKKVKEFHDTFEHPVLEKPMIPAERTGLRIGLIEEELGELKEAIQKGDLVEVADAFCDLQYVLSGAILEFGMKDVFDRMFDDVHRSNMSKACSTAKEVHDTAYMYQEMGVEFIKKAIHINGEPKVIFLRKHDLKLLKNKHYEKTNLKQFIDNVQM